MMVHLLCELKREPEVFDQSFLSYLFTSVVLTYKLLCISYSGIYYGTSATVPMMGRNGIGSTFDAGMLTYESLTKQDKGSGKGILSTTPLSLGLTKHHFITLSSVNDVKFVNRVAKKVIQEERVDWVSVSSAAENDLQYGSFREGSGALAELITDVRRPDQIWLRKGRSLVHISSSYEERDVWKYTLARCIETVPPTTSSPRHNPNALTSEEKHIEGQFEHAKSLCNNTVRGKDSEPIAY